MKKNRLFFMFAALFVAAAVMSSCQKEDISLNSEDGLMLKAAYDDYDCADACIDKENPEYFEMTDFEEGSSGRNAKKVTYVAYNTLSEFVIDVTYEITAGNAQAKADITVEFESETPAVFEDVEGGTTVTAKFPLPDGWQACDEVEFSITQESLGQPIVWSGVKYGLFGACPEECVDAFTLEDVSECGETDRYAEFKFIAGEDGEVKIQGGLTSGASDWTSEVWVNETNVGELNYGVNPAGHVHNWIGTLVACDEVVIKIWWTADNEDIIDSWSVERDGEAVGVTDAVDCLSIFEIIEASEDHTTLETAVIAAELDETLDEGGPFTVFAPTDDAFDALPAGTVEALLEDPTGALKDILLYHVVEGKAKSTDLSDGQVITTMLGEDVTVTIDADGVWINDAKVIVADILAHNGVVHVIDAVL